MTRRMARRRRKSPGSAAGSGRLPPSFDGEFTDIVDYILRITHRIWEERQVERCRDYYTADCPVYTPAGVTIGADEVTRATHAMLASFPDRTLEGESVIWSREGNRFHSSHRILTRMTNLGPSDMGPATGRGARFRVIAHCVVEDNRICREWLVRDNWLLAEQLGFEPLAVARKWSRQPIHRRLANWLDTEFRRVQSAAAERLLPGVPEHGVGAKIAAAISAAWRADALDPIRAVYADNATMHVPRGRTIRGIDAIAGFYWDFRKALSDFKASIDHCCGEAPPEHGDCLALRWTLAGRHTKMGMFGKPGGAEVVIPGESQYRLKDGKIAEEWMVYDELSVWVQIFRAACKETTGSGHGAD